MALVNREDAKDAKIFLDEDPELDRLAFAVIGAAIEVHWHLGPGYLESIYQGALCRELALRRMSFVSQPPVWVDYKGRRVGEGKLDLLVGSKLIVELKAVDELAPIHTAQVISYLKATDLKLGLLINFNVPKLKGSIRRVVRTK
jgi:GxxExxY protein